MFVFFLSLIDQRALFKIHEHLFPPYIILFGYNIHNTFIDRSYTFFNISLYIVTQNAPINSLTYLIQTNLFGHIWEFP